MAEKIKRKYTRFNSNPLDIALVQLLPCASDFKPQLAGVIINEAHGGCGLVVISKRNISAGDAVRVQVGKLAPLMGTVAWVNLLSDNIYKIGIQFLE